MEAHLRETLEPDSAPSDFTVSEEMFDGSSSLSPEMPVSEENLGESSTSLHAEALGDPSLVAASNQNGSSPKPQDDRSLVLLASNPTGSSTILPPINQTLSWSSSMPAQTEPVDDYPNFSICSDDEALEVEPFASSPDRFFRNNLLESSSSRRSSSHGSSPWPSCSSSRGTWSSSPSALSFSIGDIKPSMGAGLANLGNTCFINAVLQCFTHTVPLVQVLLSCSHAMPCDRGSEGFCVLCALIDHVERSLASSGGVISPLKLVDNLNHISSFFQRYQQEDAHEFLQCFLDKLERCCLDLNIKDKTLLPQDNNLVERVFGGRLVSKLRCCNCGHSSDTYEPLIDLSLEIEDVDTLPSALESFTKVEKIEDSETKFTCENCKEEVLVEKQFMLDQAPSVAAFHLKRFKTDGSFVEKVDKHVQFPLELDLQPFTTGSQHNNVELKYNLYAIVVHIGFSSTSGHYFCFIRSSPATWHRLDDSKVTSVAEEFVLSQEAYILFYAREGTPWFSSLMEAQKPLFDPNIFNTSPKSVLDNADSVCASYPSVAGIINCDANESRNAAEGNSSMFSCGSRQEGVEVNEARDAAAGSSGYLSCRSKQDELRSNDPKDGTPMDYTSTQLGAHTRCDGSYNDEKLCTTSSLGGNSCQKGIDEVKDDGFHSLTPPGSPSPDKASLASPGVTYHIPRNHLKKEKQVSCKKQLNKALEDSDSERREAVRYLSKSAPHGRNTKLLAAVLGSHSDGPLNKRKRMVSSPCKKTSTPSARRKPNHGSIMQPVAAAIFR
ncbi:ubiquitin carboxyl-terminal hydrolase 20 isoform X2 [Corylus avellana]|uniref:ubiquitin carboxyl-terminal hydrolase 20 isoform X2 n=1 Tax=Corylus avellana TaxID=13451 RepID=UPI00286C332A|nr:ubiquitin carboxyl-terminal hydrolase 20 isoform X2 [Corylus avellana]